MRAWSILEQVVEDPATKLRLEFSSVHTDELNAGREAPSNDEYVLLRLWTSDRERMATFRFQRNGSFLNTMVEAPSAAVGQMPEPETFGREGDGGDGHALPVASQNLQGPGPGPAAGVGRAGGGGPAGGSPVDAAEIWKEDPELAEALGLARPMSFT